MTLLGIGGAGSPGGPQGQAAITGFFWLGPVNFLWLGSPSPNFPRFVG